MKIIVPIMEDYHSDTDIYNRELTEIERKTILHYVFDFLNEIKNAEFIIILKRNDMISYSLDYMIRLLLPNAKIVIAEGNTKGSVCSCLLAIDEIDENEPLIIAGCNQLFTDNPQNSIDFFEKEGYDGGAIVFEDVHPRWSYFRINTDGLVTEVAEKRPISKNAATGMYYFKKGIFFIDAAMQMIKKEATVKDMILKQMKIGVYQISKQHYFNFRNDQSIDEFRQYIREKHKEV